MTKLKGLTKVLTVGALAMAISVPAGMASAATVNTVQYKVYYVTNSANYDWGAWLQQYYKMWTPSIPTTTPTQPATTAPKPTTQPTTQVPTTTTAPKPTTQPTTSPKPTTTQPAATTTSSSYAAQVVDLVNRERAKAGLKPLASNAKLANMAMVKAQDMKNNNYFDHNSPTYGSPFDMMKQFGITYRYAGENIAMGQRSPQEVMTAWMNSAGHKANILNANFTTIGVAYYNGEWVQEFTG